MKAIVKEIQVGGYHLCHSLQEACQEFLGPATARAKILFAIQLPSGEVKQITIRDEDGETVAYGDFEGLPDFLDYSKEVLGVKITGEEATRKEKTRLPVSFLRRLICKLGLHQWASIYTRYSFDPDYKIAWNQYCLYCPTERENPLIHR